MEEAAVRGRVNPPNPTPPARAASHPQRVLIVEDEPALLRALRINLRARGYEVTTAKTGRAALTEAARRPPDAVPLDIEELLARLRAALRRDDPVGAEDIRLGDWRIDLVAYRATRNGDESETARLTPTEWRLLEILLRHPGQLVPAGRLLTTVWGPGYENNTNYLRFHMAKLRAKLEEDPSRPRYLITEPGMGYRYQPEGTSPGRRP